MSGSGESTCTLVLVRLRQGACGEAGRTAHLVSLPRDTEASGVMGALCGESLVADQVETVAPGVGMALVNPEAPEDWVLLAGELSGVSLPWPSTVRPVTGTLALPPSTTPLGPVTWRRAPATPELAECREIDLLSAVCTVLRAAAHISGEGS